LAFPAVYLSAAGAVDRIGVLVASWLPAGAAARRGIRWVPPVVLLAVVGLAAFGDVRGDLSLARAWWQ
jgi:hypothetical protein